MALTTIGIFIGKEVLSFITKRTLERLERLKIKDSFLDKNEYKSLINNFPERYSIHYNVIIKWATSIPFINLSKPVNTEDSTVELLMSSELVNNKNKKVSEEEILQSTENILLIGAPGAGKTTTLKRLVLKYIANSAKYDNTGFPILIKLREVPSETNIYKFLLNIFGINYEDKVVKKDEEIINKSKKGGADSHVVRAIETYVGDLPADIFLSKFLNETNCFLLLDGLDEIRKSDQLQTLRDIEKLALELTTSKILMTVRKSELHKVIDDFQTLEIASLSESQISDISEKWLKNNSNFLNTLHDKTYKELANIPIYLTFLLILYRKTETLPNRPSEIYDDITNLIIREWDEHRDILRQSKYSDFSSRRKLSFLSEISFHLTYRIKQKVFSSQNLEEIYDKIRDKYKLPEDEMKYVIAEIESHTGLLVESTYRHFEFTHLSIQEFLCAKYIEKLPYSRETVRYFIEYPEPIAIAISMSLEPSAWFSNLILNRSFSIDNFRKNEVVFYSSIYVLLNRLLLEGPQFTKTIELGNAFFYLISNCYRRTDFTILLDTWFAYTNVKESIALWLKGAESIYNSQGFYIIAKKEATPTELLIDIVSKGEIPERFFRILINEKLIDTKDNCII